MFSVTRGETSFMLLCVMIYQFLSFTTSNLAELAHTTHVELVKPKPLFLSNEITFPCHFEMLNQG